MDQDPVALGSVPRSLHLTIRQDTTEGYRQAGEYKEMRHNCDIFLPYKVNLT